MMSPIEFQLGILYFGNIYTDQPPFFGLEDHHFQQLARIAPNYGLNVLVFSAQGTDLHKKKILGYRLDSLQQWELTESNLPRVIYVRGISTLSSENEERYRLLTIFEKMNIDMINNNAFSELAGDKLAFHRYFQTTSLSPYLPATEAFNPKRLLNFCQRYPVVFLKPIDGFESRGLIRIETSLERTVIDFSDDLGNLQKLQGAIDQVLPNILDFIKERAYVIQEGISRKLLQNRLVEHRILFQRVGDQWFQTAHVLRLNSAQNLPFITAGREKNYLYQEAPFSLEIPHQAAFDLEIKHLGQQLCLMMNLNECQASEFSMDFIVDLDHRIKILECNARPSGFFLQTGNWQGRMLYIARTLQQAQFLISQFPNRIPN
jgi:hypothetical protein